MEHLVPLKRESWNFFDRQRDTFKSLFSGQSDEWADFDQELERIKKDMFTLKPMDFGGGGSDFGSGRDPFGDFGSSGTKKVSSSSTTKTTMTTTTSSSGKSNLDSDDFASSAMMKQALSDFDSGDFGSSSSSSTLLKVEHPIVMDHQGNKWLSLRFDCKQFKPEEISVKTVDNRLMVQAKHTEESPGRKVYREFSRQYILPEKIDPLTLNSSLAADGVLSIEGPAPASAEAPRERILPIKFL